MLLQSWKQIPEYAKSAEMFNEGVNYRRTKYLARGNWAKCLAKKFNIVCLNVKNVLRRFSFSCPAKSQNVRRGTHGSPVQMFGEAQHDFAYSKILKWICIRLYIFSVNFLDISQWLTFKQVCLRLETIPILWPCYISDTTRPGTCICSLWYLQWVV